MELHQITNSTLPYNDKIARQTILKIRKGNSIVSKKNKEILFFMLGRIVVKNIYNFWFLARAYISKEGEFLCDEDVISECYIILDTCIKNFVIAKDKWGAVRKDIDGNAIHDYSQLNKASFGFYFNKSLSRNLNKRLQKILKRFNNQKSFSLQDEGYSFYENLPVLWTGSSTNQYHDLMRLDLENLGLTRDEIEIVLSRVNHTKTSDFIRNSTKFNDERYYETLKSIKLKLYGKINKNTD